MFDGVYNYFFGSDSAQPITTSTNIDGNEWIFVDQTSGRSSPVLVADLDVQELRDEDIESVSSDKQQINGQQANRQWLRKARKDISSQTKKQQISELIKRRQEVEKMLFEDSSGNDSSSTSSSPIACSSPSSAKQMDTIKPMISRKKKCAHIKQPRSAKNDSRKVSAK